VVNSRRMGSVRTSRSFLVSNSSNSPRRTSLTPHPKLNPQGHLRKGEDLKRPTSEPLLRRPPVPSARARQYRRLAMWVPTRRFCSFPDEGPTEGEASISPCSEEADISRAVSHQVS
jgi:hypothetical protein